MLQRGHRLVMFFRTPHRELVRRVKYVPVVTGSAFLHLTVFRLGSECTQISANYFQLKPIGEDGMILIY
jgi:hypothetical protein